MNKSDQTTHVKNIDSAILIAEDDNDQRSLLVNYVMSQIKIILNDETLSDQQIKKLKDVQIMSVSNIASLERAASKNKRFLLAIIDCNIPDTKGSPSHDQFIKTNHKITGQHRSVDIVTKQLPTTPVTIISSLNRFRSIIKLFYKNKFGIEINFINKNEPSEIRKNIRYYLRQSLK